MLNVYIFRVVLSATLALIQRPLFAIIGRCRYCRRFAALLDAKRFLV